MKTLISLISAIFLLSQIAFAVPNKVLITPTNTVTKTTWSPASTALTSGKKTGWVTVNGKRMPLGQAMKYYPNDPAVKKALKSHEEAELNKIKKSKITHDLGVSGKAKGHAAVVSGSAMGNVGKGAGKGKM